MWRSRESCAALVWWSCWPCPASRWFRCLPTPRCLRWSAPSPSGYTRAWCRPSRRPPRVTPSSEHAATLVTLVEDFLIPHSPLPGPSWTLSCSCRRRRCSRWRESPSRISIPCWLSCVACSSSRTLSIRSSLVWCSGAWRTSVPGSTEWPWSSCVSGRLDGERDGDLMAICSFNLQRTLRCSRCQRCTRRTSSPSTPTWIWSAAKSMRSPRSKGIDWVIGWRVERLMHLSISGWRRPSPLARRWRVIRRSKWFEEGKKVLVESSGRKQTDHYHWRMMSLRMILD